eukprot:14640201-Alexandrium_andersonii.AAC.1
MRPWRTCSPGRRGSRAPPAQRRRRCTSLRAILARTGARCARGRWRARARIGGSRSAWTPRRSS